MESGRDGTPDPGGRVAVGRIIGAHGVRGEVKVAPLTDWPERMGALGTVWLTGDDGGAVPDRFETERSRPTAAGFLVKFRGVEDRDAAERLRGRWIEIPRSQCATPEPGRYFLFDLVGLRVETPDGEPVGEVRDVVRAGARHLLVIGRPGAEDALVPLAKPLVHDVDLAAGKIVIDAIEGLL